jgi:hypothetical protein
MMATMGATRAGEKKARWEERRTLWNGTKCEQCSRWTPDLGLPERSNEYQNEMTRGKIRC